MDLVKEFHMLTCMGYQNYHFQFPQPTAEGKTYQKYFIYS